MNINQPRPVLPSQAVQTQTTQTQTTQTNRTQTNRTETNRTLAQAGEPAPAMPARLGAPGAATGPDPAPAPVRLSRQVYALDEHIAYAPETPCPAMATTTSTSSQARPRARRQGAPPPGPLFSAPRTKRGRHSFAGMAAIATDDTPPKPARSGMGPPKGRERMYRLDDQYLLEARFDQARPSGSALPPPADPPPGLPVADPPPATDARRSRPDPQHSGLQHSGPQESAPQESALQESAPAPADQPAPLSLPAIEVPNRPEPPPRMAARFPRPQADFSPPAAAIMLVGMLGDHSLMNEVWDEATLAMHLATCRIVEPRLQDMPTVTMMLDQALASPAGSAFRLAAGDTMPGIFRAKLLSSLQAPFPIMNALEPAAPLARAMALYRQITPEQHHVSQDPVARLFMMAGACLHLVSQDQVDWIALVNPEEVRVRLHDCIALLDPMLRDHSLPPEPLIIARDLTATFRTALRLIDDHPPLAYAMIHAAAETVLLGTEAFMVFWLQRAPGAR